MREIYKKYMWEILLALAALSYSFEWYFLRGLNEVWYSSLEITFGKIAIAVFILILFFSLFRREYLKPSNVSKRDYWLLFLSWMNLLVGSYLYTEAINNTSVATTLTLAYLWVFWWLFVWVVFFKDKFSFNRLFYVFLAFVWMLLTISEWGVIWSFSFGRWELFAFLVSFLWVTSTVISKKLSDVQGFVRVMIKWVFVSFIILVWYLALYWPSYFVKFATVEYMTSCTFLAITAVILWKGLKELWINYVPASIVLVIMLLEPIGQMTTAYFFWGESIGFVNLIWIMLVLSMTVLVSRRSDEKKIVAREPETTIWRITLLWEKKVVE